MARFLRFKTSYVGQREAGELGEVLSILSRGTCTEDEDYEVVSAIELVGAKMNGPRKEPPKLTEDERAFIIRYFEELVGEQMCPICHQPLTGKEQRSQCVYGQPCGCRMYQGTV